ncbi:MAG TPA: nicotinate phosphoribosyltransferase [Stenomitos sp.]
MAHRPSPAASTALFSDFYELTMAYAYWQHGRHMTPAVFHHSFRQRPFQGGYALAGGLGELIEWLDGLRFTERDVAYLASLTDIGGKPMFAEAFLDFLLASRFECSVDAIPEGTLVFAHEPLARVTGPIWQAQYLESAVLNFLNAGTLFTTKAARICHSADDQPVLEFGMRRAQFMGAALSGARACYIGGSAGTSCMLAGQRYGIPLKGTHAHSWVMFWEDELEAFKRYAEALPSNCLFLVDTYDTLDGVRNAIQVGRWLRSRGHDLLGIRLDSGDLAYFSIEARRLLDEAGFPEAVVTASSDLDEYLIQSLKTQDARIVVWGVGTKLITCYDQPALGGVYKLGAVQEDGRWHHRIKLSEQSIKVSIPGILQVRRFQNARGEYVGDMIYDLERPAPDPWIIDPADPIRRKYLGASHACEDLLIPIYRAGQRVYEVPSLETSRERVRRELSRLHPSYKRLQNPHLYPAGIERELYAYRQSLIAQVKDLGPDLAED